jgi:hypothetical protein
MKRKETRTAKISGFEAGQTESARTAKRPVFPASSMGLAQSPRTRIYPSNREPFPIKSLH